MIRCDGDHPLPRCADPQCWRTPVIDGIPIRTGTLLHLIDGRVVTVVIPDFVTMSEGDEGDGLIVRDQNDRTPMRLEWIWSSLVRKVLA